MSQVTRANSKLKFQTADVPSQADFEDLHDSVQWYDETNMPTEYTTSVPATPSTGITAFSLKRGATALAWVNSIGEYFEAMPHTGVRREMAVSGDAGSSTAIFTKTRSGLFNATGTPAARTPALGSILSQSFRLGLDSAGTAGQTAGYRFNTAYFSRGNAAGQGGFDITLKFGIPATAAGWLFFAGMGAANLSSASTDPSTLVNKFAFAKDAADATLQLIYNDAAGSCTKVNTTITPSTTTIYLARFWCKPNDSNMYAAIYDFENNVLFESGAISSNIPANNTMLLWQIFISNNATAAVVSVDLLQGTMITNH